MDKIYLAVLQNCFDDLQGSITSYIEASKSKAKAERSMWIRTVCLSVVTAFSLGLALGCFIASV